MEFNLNENISVKFLTQKNENSPLLFLRIGAHFKFYLYPEGCYPDLFNNSVSCEKDGIKIFTKDCLCFNSSTFKDLDCILKTCEKFVTEDCWKMNRDNTNALVFDYFVNEFEEWLDSVGAQADPKSFDHLNLSNYLTRVRDALLKYYGLKIFSPK